MATPRVEADAVRLLGLGIDALPDCVVCYAVPHRVLWPDAVCPPLSASLHPVAARRPKAAFRDVHVAVHRRRVVAGARADAGGLPARGLPWTWPRAVDRRRRHCGAVCGAQAEGGGLGGRSGHPARDGGVEVAASYAALGRG
eukprot:255248-Chlamydomonas_euryale.AAC.2